MPEKTGRRADTTFEEIASDAVEKRRPRAVETKQRATAGSTRLPEPKGRWPGIVEEGSRHQVSQSLGALISKPAVRFKDQRPHSSDISLRPLELARSRSDPWLQRTDSATFCMRATHGDVHPELLRDIQGTRRQRPRPHQVAASPSDAAHRLAFPGPRNLQPGDQPIQRAQKRSVRYGLP